MSEMIEKNLKGEAMMDELIEKNSKGEATMSEMIEKLNVLNSNKGESNMTEEKTDFNRYDFVVYVSAKNGNINGDPDNGNAPRIDTATGLGIVTDVSIKHHIREACKIIYGDNILIDKDNISIDTLVNKLEEIIKSEKKGKNIDKAKDLYEKLCKLYIDVRWFGAVLAGDTKPITGPIQISMGQSIDPISINNSSITRGLHNKVEKAEKGGSQFGDKPFATYGLYQFTGEINPYSAKGTGLTQEDITKFFASMNKAFTLWSSAQKGEIETVKIVIFKHSSPLGNAKKNKLFSCIDVHLRDGVKVPTDFNDYVFDINKDAVPAGVSVEVID